MPISIPDLITTTIDYGMSSPYQLLDLHKAFDREDLASLQSDDLWLKFLKEYFPGQTEVIKKMEACVLASNRIKSGATTSKDAVVTPDGVVKQEFVRLAKELRTKLLAGEPSSLVGAERHIMDEYFIRRVFKLTTPREVNVKLLELCELSDLISNSIGDAKRLMFCLSLYPKEERLEKVEQKPEREWDEITRKYETVMRRNQLLLHRAVTNPESFMILLELYPKDEITAVLKMKDQTGVTPLHRAAANVELLKAILDLIPSEGQMAAIEQKDSEGNTILHTAAVGNPESLNFILSLYPVHKRIAALEQRNNSQRTVLHRAFVNSESFQAALNQYPVEKRRAALEQRDMLGRTVLNASSYHPEAIKLILSHYPVNERLAAVTDESKNGQALFHAAAKYSPGSLPAIINLLPEHHQILMLKKIVNGMSLADILTHNKLTLDNSFAQDYIFIEYVLNQNNTSQKRGGFYAPTKSAATICVDWDKAPSFDEIKMMVINFLSQPENSESMVGRRLLSRLVKGEDKQVDALAKQWSIPIETLSQKQSPAG